MALFCSKCGERNKDSDDICKGCNAPLKSGPLPPDIVLEKRYKIISSVKTGGMGAVYKARDLKLNNICAVKELLPSYENTDKQKQAEEWFKREAKLLAGLDHANLPKVSDYFVSDNRYYLVMSFVEGEDLENVLEKEGKPGLSQDKVLHITVQILKVLDYLHSQKPPIIYRDIKPANIMLHKDGRAMLIDFGIARALQHDSNTIKTAIGTPGYVPEEQCHGVPEPRSDIYALGATMHHLLTGEPPRSLRYNFKPLSKIMSDISPALENIVMKALEDDPGKRFSSAAEMLREIRETCGVSTGLIEKTIPLKKKKTSLLVKGFYFFIIIMIIAGGLFLIKNRIASHRLDGSWVEQKEEDGCSLLGVYFIDGITGWAVGENGMIFQTENGGNEWKISTIPGLSNGWLSNVFFVNKDKGWAVGVKKLGNGETNGIIVSTEDGGEKWTVDEREDLPELSDVQFIDENTGWIIGTDGSVLYTKDGGKTWEKYSSGTSGFYISDISFVNDSEGWAVGGEKKGADRWAPVILYSHDCGKNWEKQGQKLPAGGRFYGVHFVDNLRGWAAGYGLIDRKLTGYIFHTDNGGITWKDQTPASFDYLMRSVHFLNEEVGGVFAISKNIDGSISGVFIYTTDGGHTWKRQNKGFLPVFNKLFFVDSENGWGVAEEGQIFKFTQKSEN